MTGFEESGMQARAAEPTTELRGELPRWIVDVVDAVVMARGGMAANVHRTTVVTEVMGVWATGKLHESDLIQRLAMSNPTGSEGGRR